MKSATFSRNFTKERDICFSFAKNFSRLFFRFQNGISFYPCEDSQIISQIKFCLSKVLIQTVIIKRPTSSHFGRSYLRNTFLARENALTDRSFNPYPPLPPHPIPLNLPTTAIDDTRRRFGRQFGVLCHSVYYSIIGNVENHVESCVVPANGISTVHPDNRVNPIGSRIPRGTAPRNKGRP